MTTDRLTVLKSRKTRTQFLAVLTGGFILLPGTSYTAAQQAPQDKETGPTGSLMAIQIVAPTGVDGNHALRQMSLIARSSPEARVFRKHDLIQIVVRESSDTEIEQELDTEKDWAMTGEIKAFPDIRLNELLQLIMRAGRTTGLPKLDVSVGKDFEGDGNYTRQDRFSARLTAEVVDILPNGNLVLEARTHVKNDSEESVIKVTGICRPSDVTGDNTVLSNQMHDLFIEKQNRGEVKKGSQKGILTKAFEAIFAF